MPAGEIAYLSMVLVGFTVFGASLFFISRWSRKR